MQKTLAKLVVPSLFLLVFALAISSAFAKQEEKSKGADQKQEKTSIKGSEKSVTGKTNAQVFKEKADAVATELKTVAEKKKTELEQKNKTVNTQSMEAVEAEEEVTQALEEVATATQESAIETATAIEEVEEVGGFKKFFIGTDYKNLGQLRKSLVHNRNQIRKLTSAAADTQDEATKLAIDAQLVTLMQEREVIKTVITTNEGGFSLLGWVSRFLNGYEQTPVDGQEEVQLVEEVKETIASEIVESADSSAVGSADGTVNTETVTETIPATDPAANPDAPVSSTGTESVQ